MNENEEMIPTGEPEAQVLPLNEGSVEEKSALDETAEPIEEIPAEESAEAGEASGEDGTAGTGEETSAGNDVPEDTEETSPDEVKETGEMEEAPAEPETSLEEAVLPEAEEASADPIDEAPAEDAAAGTEEILSGKEEVDEATRVFPKLETKPARLDGVQLACDLCDAVLAQVGRDGFHGGVRPDNISIHEGKVKLGNPLEHGVGEFTPQELEYMSPELFWDGSRSGSADVYSVGLVLYAVYNHGLMPFWPVDTEATPNIRASALQRRMNKEELSPPASAGSELSAIILRALAFTPEERWADTEELRNALFDCREEQPMATDISVVLAAMMEKGSHSAEKKNSEVYSPFVSDIGEDDEAPVSDDGDEAIPKVKVRRSASRLPQVLVYIALAISIVAIVLLLRRCVALDEEARATPTPPMAAVKEPSEEDKIISGDLVTEEQPGEELPEAPAEPVVEATPAPVGKVEYVAVRENVSWSEAVRRCEEMGGTLAMPTTYEEFQAITAQCEAQGLTFAWLNAQRNAEGKWVNDQGAEENFFFAWGDGEPSGFDGGDGVAEDYFLLWNHNGRWSGNDSRENPLTSYMHVYGGKIGFVCKKVSYESVNITDLGG